MFAWGVVMLTLGFVTVGGGGFTLLTLTMLVLNDYSRSRALIRGPTIGTPVRFNVYSNGTTRAHTNVAAGKAVRRTSTNFNIVTKCESCRSFV